MCVCMCECDCFQANKPGSDLVSLPLVRGEPVFEDVISIAVTGLVKLLLSCRHSTSEPPRRRLGSNHSINSVEKLCVAVEV